jgi:hypothetical protein
MTPASTSRVSSPSRVVRAVLGALPNLITRLRRDPPPESKALPALLAIAGLLVFLGNVVGIRWIPAGVQIVPLLGGGLLLGRKAFTWLVLGVILSLAATYLLESGKGSPPGGILVVSLAGLVAYEFARSRDETGLGGLTGDGVLMELKRRLDLQGDMPQLPSPWHAEVVVRPAGGGPFAGDFVVSALSEHRLEICLVDVSGKGVEAGTRALLLSGALGGLLGAKEPKEYMEAANTYLIRQDWEEGFATAMHLTVDLTDGAYTITSAGHPPVAHFDAGSGRWDLDLAEGPALGLLPSVAYESTYGTLRPGDALLLYTDGLVEVPGRDLEVGIDKLLGEAERLVPRGFEGGGDILVSAVAADGSDDRGLVLLWRSAN